MQTHKPKTLPPLNKTGIFNIPTPTSYTNYPPMRATLINGTRTNTLQSAINPSKSPYMSRSTISSAKSKPSSAQNSKFNSAFNFQFQTIQGRRYSNEDAEVIFTNQNFTLAAIFDGHGGARVSKISSQIFPGLLQLALTQTPQNQELAISTAIAQLEDKIIQNTSLCEQGSTLAAVLIINSKLFTFHVGDSRVILGMKNQSHIATRDHSPDDPSEIDRIGKIRGAFISREFGISRVQGVLSLSRAVGDGVLKQFGVICQEEIHEFPLQDISYVLIACDGLFNIFSDAQVDMLVKGMRTGKNEQKGEDQMLCEIAINYCAGRAREGDLGVKKLTGLPPDRNSYVCDVDRQAGVEKRICQVLVKMAYWLGSTDNITCMVCFLE